MVTQSATSYPLRLDPSSLIQMGGEGAVYAHNGRAIKRYHRPDAQRTKKLLAFQAGNLAQQLPATVYAPRQLHFGPGGDVVGFEMSLLPPTAHPIKKLAHPSFSKQHAMDLRTEIDLLLALFSDLKAIHQAGVIVGDLNDHNIFFNLPAPGATPYTTIQCHWIDVDSFQFQHFPCVVALDNFLDPHLYHVASFSTKAVFSRESDWYAFAVLLCNTLLKTHPYGGVHHQLKTIAARAEARVTVFDPQVIYPTAARHPHVLNDALLDYLRQVFSEGQRIPPPAEHLRNLRQNLVHCPQCHEIYSGTRAACPVCTGQSYANTMPVPHAGLKRRTLLEAQGTIASVHVLPDQRIAVILRHENRYSLLLLDENGPHDETPLFSGAAGARFAFFQELLVINPAGRQDLLLVDYRQSPPRLIQTIPTEPFRQGSAFAATRDALYRLANGYILRGRMQRGHYLDEIVATAHKGQTQLWASPHSDHVAGYHHILGKHHFFLLDGSGRQLTIEPATATSQSMRRILEIDVAWGQKHLAFLWHEKSADTLLHHLQINALQGDLHFHAISAAGSPPFNRLDGRVVGAPSLLLPTDRGILKVNKAGQSLLKETASACSSAATLLHHASGMLIQQARTLHLFRSI